MRVVSWNVNGIRAVIKKDAFKPFVRKTKPDIICLQETKAEQGQAEIDLPKFEEYWNSAEKKGYSGTAIFTKPKPLAVWPMTDTATRLRKAGSSRPNTRSSMSSPPTSPMPSAT